MNKRWLLIFTLLFSASGFLSSCKHIKTKASPLLNIPASCKDTEGKFVPISRILSKGSYNNKPQHYMPIKDPKGFITQDFNQDRKPDFLFIERSGADIKFVSCLSSKGENRRRVTSFKVHETIEPDFQTISEIIRMENNYLVLIINNHEHNWGSDIETSRYLYSKKHDDFMLVQQEIISSSGDGSRSDSLITVLASVLCSLAICAKGSATKGKSR